MGDEKKPMVFALTDLGNGERLAAFFGDRIRFVAPWKKWLVWDSRRWRIDDTGAISRLAKRVVRNLKNDIGDPAYDTSDLCRHAYRSEASARINAMIEMASTEKSIQVRPEALDADPWLLNVMNGTLDLRTGELRPHQQNDLVTKLAPHAYLPDAESDIWSSFLSTITSAREDLAAFIQRFAGYSLTGSTQEQCFAILHGGGANGKSTLVEALRNMLGDYAAQADFRTFLDRRDDAATNDIARLRGARMVSAVEADEGKRLAESTVKHLTGGDSVTARFLYCEPFEFVPQFKLWLASNHKPVIKGDGEGMWRRINLIPLDATIPPNQRDGQLAEKLRAEMPAILAWAVRGCRDWIAGGLRRPEVILNATRGYQDDMDLLGAFLDECCMVGDGLRTGAGTVYAAYRAWSEKRGENSMTQTSFGRKLRDRGFVSDKVGTRFWCCLEVVNRGEDG